MTSTRPTDARTTRRSLLSLVGTATLGGLAGCSGGTDAGGDGTPSTSRSPTTAAARTVSPTPTPELDLTPAAAFDCETITGSLPTTAYDASDGPFVFTFDYPQGWIVRPNDTPTSDGVVVSAPVEVSTGGFLFEVWVDQYYEPVAENAFEQRWDDSWTEAGTLTFAGEERSVVEKPSGDPGRYILSVIVRDTQAAAPTYRQVTIDGFNLSFEEACFDNFRAAGDALLQSLRPKA